MLARAYSEATVGLCLSLTNYSLIPQEMLACGLPCVDLAGASTEAELGRDGGVELAEPDPIAHRRRDRAPARRPRPVGAALRRARPGPRAHRGTRRRGRWSAACARRCASASATATPRPPHERRAQRLSRAPQHERAEASGDRRPLPGARFPPGRTSSTAMCARVQLERAQVEPVAGLRELVAGRAGVPAVDPHLHLAPERAAQPDLVAPGPRHPQRPAPRPDPTVRHERGIVRRGGPSPSGRGALRGRQHAGSHRAARASAGAAAVSRPPARGGATRPRSSARSTRAGSSGGAAPADGPAAHDENAKALDVLAGAARRGRSGSRTAAPRRRE